MKYASKKNNMLANIKTLKPTVLPFLMLTIFDQINISDKDLLTSSNFLTNHVAYLVTLRNSSLKNEKSVIM